MKRMVPSGKKKKKRVLDLVRFLFLVFFFFFGFIEALFWVLVYWIQQTNSKREKKKYTTILSFYKTLIVFVIHIRSMHIRPRYAA